jgi:hypothetical protein
MALLAKRHSYLTILAILGFMATAAVVVARIINLALEAGLRELPAAPIAGREGGSIPPGRRSVEASTIVARNIFNSAAWPTPEPAKGTEALAFKATAPPEEGETDLDLELVAVAWADHPAWSFALIRERRTEDSGLIRIGDLLRGEAEVRAIEWRRVVLWREGRLETLTMFGGGRPRRAPEAGNAPRPDEKPHRAIRKVGENEYLIAREEYQRQLDGWGGFAGVRVVPVLQDGVGAGFRLLGVAPASLAATLGLRDGDTVVQRQADRVTLDLVRDGVRRTLTYTLTE